MLIYSRDIEISVDKMMNIEPDFELRKIFFEVKGIGRSVINIPENVSFEKIYNQIKKTREDLLEKNNIEKKIKKAVDKIKIKKLVSETEKKTKKDIVKKKVKPKKDSGNRSKDRFNAVKVLEVKTGKVYISIRELGNEIKVHRNTLSKKIRETGEYKGVKYKLLYPEKNDKVVGSVEKKVISAKEWLKA